MHQFTGFIHTVLYDPLNAYAYTLMFSPHGLWRSVLYLHLTEGAKGSALIYSGSAKIMAPSTGQHVH